MPCMQMAWFTQQQRAGRAVWLCYMKKVRSGQSSLACLSTDVLVGRLLWEPQKSCRRCWRPSLWRSLHWRVLKWMQARLQPSSSGCRPPGGSRLFEVSFHSGSEQDAGCECCGSHQFCCWASRPLCSGDEQGGVSCRLWAMWRCVCQLRALRLWWEACSALEEVWASVLSGQCAGAGAVVAREHIW